MFKKKPSIKTLSPLRSSDRRKTADRIISDYGLEAQKSDSGDQDEAATTAARSALRNSILPDNALTAKFETTHGPDLAKVSGTVYVGSHGKQEQRVLWIKLEEVLYPSVYTLWRNPGIIPLLHTPSVVISKLQGGADLMTPGLAGPPFPAKAKKGAVVAVASLENPSVPVVVGTCLIDISSLTKAQGAKGQAVETFHWSGDHVWDWSTSGKAGIPAPAELQGWLEDPTSTLAQDIDNLELEDQGAAEGGVALKQEDEITDASVAAASKPRVNGDEVAEQVDMDAEADISTADIDRAFKQAFFYGVYQQRESNRTAPKFGLTFPLSQSFVISNLVNPYLPIFTTKQAEIYSIKKTSWKNAKKFLKQLDKDKLILTKDTKTENLVLDIDFEDANFVNFQPYRLPKKESSPNNSTGQKDATAASASDDDAEGQTLKVINLYRPASNLAPFLKGAAAGEDKTYYTRAELAPLISNYVETENLVSANNKRLVRLDPFLANSVFSSNQRGDAEVLAKGAVTRDALLERTLAACAPFHIISRNGAELDQGSAKAQKPKAGAAPRIEIVLETRSGNKTATRVHGLEPYHVAAQPLADELRKTCAGSTAVEPWRAGKGLEVMVQGPQRESVVRALERRGVHQAWIDVVDKVKKK